MICCPKIVNPVPESEDLDSMRCPHIGFYMDARTSEIHGYCFDPDKIDTCNYKQPGSKE